MRLLILFSFCVFIGCNNSKTFLSKEYIEDANYIEVSINELIHDPQNYDEKNVEIIGIFYYGMEESSLNGINSEDRVWIDFNYSSKPFDNEGNSLYDNNKLLKFSSKKVLIKGIFDKDDFGHLGLYKGSIKNIEYFSTDVK